jgi:hypothetical protein
MLKTLPIDDDVAKGVVALLQNAVVTTYDQAVIIVAQALCSHRTQQHVHFPEFAEVIQERMRQVELEGYTKTLDDRWIKGELAQAAVAYVHGRREEWPWDPITFKRGQGNGAGYRKNLVKAAALILAEISRLDRIPDVSKPLHSTGLPD